MTAQLHCPDADLKGRVTRYLNHRTAETVTGLRVEARGGTIVLQGTVRSLHEQEVCRHVCTRVAGVLRVVDETVVRESSPAQTGVNRLPR